MNAALVYNPSYEPCGVYTGLARFATVLLYHTTTDPASTVRSKSEGTCPPLPSLYSQSLEVLCANRTLPSGFRRSLGPT